LRVKGGLLTEPIATWLKLNGQHPLFLNIVEIQLQETLMHPVVNIELGFKAIDIFNCHNNFFEKGLENNESRTWNAAPRETRTAPNISLN